MTKKISKPAKPVKAIKSVNAIKATKAQKNPPAKLPAKVSSKEIKKETPKITTKSVAHINTNKVITKLGSKIGGFKAGDYAFYPSHGVGKILQIDTIEVAGQSLGIIIMYFEREKLTIKVPANQVAKTGLRHLISKTEMNSVFDILKSGVKKLKGMWSRRAQEYEAKINSGNIVLLAEVLRDLTRDIEDGDRSYSERIIYETAINRLSLEYSVIENITFEEAKDKIISAAKHKLALAEEIKPPKDSFDDEFDLEEESEDDDEEGEEDDFDGDDEDGDKPKKRGRKKKK